MASINWAMTCVTMKITIREWYANTIKNKNFPSADYVKYLLWVLENIISKLLIIINNLDVFNYKILLEKIL